MAAFTGGVGGVSECMDTELDVTGQVALPPLPLQMMTTCSLLMIMLMFLLLLLLFMMVILLHSDGVV